MSENMAIDLRGLASRAEQPDPSHFVEDTPSGDSITLQDERASSTARIVALARLLDTPQHKDALSYLVDELGRTDLSPEWREATVFAAEDLHFPPELRAAAGDRLLGIASSLRYESEVQDRVVWSALRRGASLLAQEQVERLLPFLRGGPVNTRTVALQAVTHLFEIATVEVSGPFGGGPSLPIHDKVPRPGCFLSRGTLLDCPVRGLRAGGSWRSTTATGTRSGQGIEPRVLDPSPTSGTPTNPKQLARPRSSV